MDKKCKQCKGIFSIDNFYKDTRVKDGHYSICKKCHYSYKKEDLNYLKSNITPERLIRRRWVSIKNRFKCKGYEKIKCLMTRDEFIKKMYTKEFLEMFNEWDKQGRVLRFAPSIDRIDSSGHYELSNIRWLQFKDNAALGGNKPNRAMAISQYTKSGVFVKTHKSSAAALRELKGINEGSGNIRRAALGKIPSAYGFKWKESHLITLG